MPTIPLQITPEERAELERKAAQMRAGALEWLRREMGYVGDALPRGRRGSEFACPIANALKMCGKGAPRASFTHITYWQDHVKHEIETPAAVARFMRHFDFGGSRELEE